MPLCEKCGAVYNFFCVACRRAEKEELTEALMEKLGLTDEYLLNKLKSHIAADSFPALSKAIDMKGLGKAQKIEIGKSDEFGEVGERINSLFSRKSS